MMQFTINHCKIALQNKKILLGITGSIAAYKSCELVRILKKCGAQVRVVLSPSAKNFVTATTLETLSEAPVLDSMWQAPGKIGTHHIEAARWADLAVVAPATAHAIAKLANGFCDDLLSTELLAFTGPLFIAPAMNPAMWAAAATSENAGRLRARGVFFLGPDTGITACGEEGLGRMMEPEELVMRLALLAATPALTPQAHPAGLSNGSVDGRPRVLITLGSTRSYADPVRFLTNRSSGKMGAALAWAAAFHGCDVTCVAGPFNSSNSASSDANGIVLPPLFCKILHVETADEMFTAATELWSAHDIFMGAAAVLDWEFAETQPLKIKKTQNDFTPPLKPSRDILQSVAMAAATARKSQFVLGFAAETNDILALGRDKLRQKKCDAIFINDVSRADRGFESADNAGFWVDPAGAAELPLASKTLLAHEIVFKCLQRWQNGKSKQHRVTAS